MLAATWRNKDVYIHINLATETFASTTLHAHLTLYGQIKTTEQRTIIHQYSEWYTGRWRVGYCIWYSEEGPGRAASPPSPFLAVPNVTAHPSTASVPTSYYSMWHYNCLWVLEGEQTKLIQSNLYFTTANWHHSNAAFRYSNISVKIYHQLQLAIHLVESTNWHKLRRLTANVCQHCGAQ